MSRQQRALGLVATALFLAVGVDAFWLEPQRLLLRDEVRLGATSAPWRIVHLSDLHIARETGVERRLVAAVAAEQPDLIAISGDLIADSGRHGVRHTRAASAVVGQLRRLAPVVAVQGHSEYLGWVVAGLEAAGLEWLSNEGRWYGGERGFLLLGLNQQVGDDLYGEPPQPPFGPVSAAGEPAYGRARPGVANAYSHYDPRLAGLADTGGPLSWSGYQAQVDVRLGWDSEAGLVVHSQYPTGEDRLLALVRTRAASTFTLVAHGSGFTAGRGNTGVDPAAGKWYRLRLRTEVDETAVRVLASVWPADEPAPADWQIDAEDSSPTRVLAGTVGLWAREGTVAYRDLKITTDDGRVLLAEPFAAVRPVAGWRHGARGTRLELALARSPEVPPDTPRIVLAHVPDVVLEAAQRGLEAVLAGHTHGGQIRLPGGIALLTRSRLGTHYDRGTFDFAAANRRGWTRLYINSGVGTSLLPIRFFCPPRYAVVQTGS